MWAHITPDFTADTDQGGVFAESWFSLGLHQQTEIYLSASTSPASGLVAGTSCNHTSILVHVHSVLRLSVLLNPVSSCWNINLYWIFSKDTSDIADQTIPCKPHHVIWCVHVKLNTNCFLINIMELIQKLWCHVVQKLLCLMLLNNSYWDIFPLA